MKYRVTVERISREAYEIEAQDEKRSIELAHSSFWVDEEFGESRKEISSENETRFIVQEVRGNT